MLIAKVNTDENPEWAQKFNVQGIPTMLFVAGGKVVHQQEGALLIDPASSLRVGGLRGRRPRVPLDPPECRAVEPGAGAPTPQIGGS